MMCMLARNANNIKQEETMEIGCSRQLREQAFSVQE